MGLPLIYQLNVTLMVALAVLCLHERTMGQTFADNFGTYHDYTSGDVTGTIWDGVLNAQNLISPSDTSNGVLNWITSGTGWENPYNGWTNGPFLYMLVSGDFDAQVYVASASANAWDDGGLMARVPNPAGGPASSENWVQMKYFSADNANAPGARWVTNGVMNTGWTSGSGTYLRLLRVGMTFYFWSKAAAADPWTLGYTLDCSDIPAMAGQLQVGLWAATFSAATDDREFGNFSLSVGSSVSIPIIITNSPPAVEMAVVSSNVSFTIGAIGGLLPLQYQWVLNGTNNIGGATNALLTLTNVQASASGNYSVIVSDVNNSVTSGPYGLVVEQAMTTLADNFGTYHDYTSGDLTGTIWDGVLNAENLTSPSDTSGGVLNWITSGTGWENPYNGWTNEPFLYELVSGDFDAQVYVASASANAWDDGGLMARVPNPLGGPASSENWVQMKYFNANYANAPGARWVTNGVMNTGWTSGSGTYLRLLRVGMTFYFWSKAAAADPWTLGYTLDCSDIPAMAGQLQVGLWAGNFNSAATDDREFGNFLLLQYSKPPASLSIARSGSQLTLSWDGLFILQRNGNVADPNGWIDVTTPSTGPLTVPITSTNEFFRLRTP